MGNIRQYIEFNVANNSTTDTIDLTEGISLYKVTTSAPVSMLNSYSIGYSGTPEEGTQLEIEYNGRIDVTGTAYTITILGTQIGQGWLQRDFVAVCNWDSGAWVVKVLPNAYLGENNKVLETTIGTGGTLTLNPGRDENTVIITGSTTLTSNYATAFGTATEGDWFDIYYACSAVGGLGTYTVTIGGVVLSRGDAYAGDVLIRCKYTGSAWSAHKYVGATNTYNRQFIVTKEVSFETGECPGINYILGNLAPLKIVSIQGFVTKALAGTDSGTITLYVNGITTGNILTGPASSALDFQLTGGGTISSTVNPGETIELRSAKTTKGGRACVTLVLEHN